MPEKDGDDELELNDGGDEQNNVRAKKKSMDREARARSSNRHNNQTDSASDNIITRAFNRFTYDDSIDPNSGTDRHNSDDFCAVIIKAKPAQGNNVSKIVHLVICKYQRFGGSSGAQLSLSWSRNDSKYRATVNVVSVAEYYDIASELCIRSTGGIVASLKNVDSSCIASIKPSLEEMVSDTGDITMNAVFRVHEVASILADMSGQQAVYHNVTDDCAIPPITVKNNTPFVTLLGFKVTT